MNKRITVTVLMTSILTACGGDSSSVKNISNNSSAPNIDGSENICKEDGKYACKSGETEPLYPFQWALRYKDSYFSTFKDIWKNDSDSQNYDINVEGVHKVGIKGQGISVLVIDDGIDIQHEDLIQNIDRNMTYNFVNQSNDPTPAFTQNNNQDAHGTTVAGIIGATQNGKGVMGIAPRVKLGGALYNGTFDELTAYGGADFSKNADIFNASYGTNPVLPESYNTSISISSPLRGLTNLRKGKGAIFIKASGNEFKGYQSENNTIRDCPSQFEGILPCENPANDLETLESNAIVVAAGNAKGIKSSYSNAGAINWITGFGGEYGEGGGFGEGDGPTIFSTDLQGCQRGYSQSSATGNLFLKGLSIYKGIKNNPSCDYSHLNGTSAATPTISGVTALILQANPNLTWRDVRDILQQSARVIDSNYAGRVGANRLVDLQTGALLTETGVKNDIRDGVTQVPLEFGWQNNGAGNIYSNWYGFGLVDAAAAVELAKKYKTGTLSAALRIPKFESAFSDIKKLSYGRVTQLGTINNKQLQTVDQFQLRVTGPICVGSVGFFVKSPSGVISVLSQPYNIYYNSGVSKADHYGLGSYAFYGEKAYGVWEVYAVSGDKGSCKANVTELEPLKVEYRIIPKAYS
ncbi:S8 family peptidase [Acinetobacter sp. YK3]|uniref:S8 family peptidase n=1 Tax=Acinetobacter sp. YK3 TaxID=1860097 RepID=UPI00084C0AAD|nr:S8 family serine peptidase [Acinetobacter sp. YK3]OEC91214.1 hypothetical protein A9Z07_17275 [Acinetobacter sp. YK3]